MQAALSHARVLLVEDNPGDARLVRALLDEYPSASVELDHVTCLDHAKGRLDAHPYDVVLLDLGLPDSRGLDTLARLAAHGPVTSLVVLTGCDDADLRNRGMALGALDWMDKDRLDASRLVRALEHALERAHLEQQLAAARRQVRRMPRQILDFILAAPEPILVLAETGHVLALNDQAAGLLGGAPATLVGRHLPSLLDTGGEPDLGPRTVPIHWKGKPAWLVALGRTPTGIVPAAAPVTRATAQRLGARAAMLDAGLRRVEAELSASADAGRKALDLVRGSTVPPRELLGEILASTLGTLQASERRLETICALARTFVREANESAPARIVERYHVDDIVRRSVAEADARVPDSVHVVGRARSSNADLLHADGPLLQRLIVDLIAGVGAHAYDPDAGVTIEVSARPEDSGVVIVLGVRADRNGRGLADTLVEAMTTRTGADDHLLAEVRRLVEQLEGRFRVGPRSDGGVWIEAFVP